ncbi:50S ribosomal protein L25/general stress protein Ctc [Myxococcus sp. AM009]|uniref:50S ribosomal protein L25/general stress protein Ctc n=1 Tax=unclassified Myxococcus TaxID=2648731 RepID=UPI001595D89D|nr:MULTISPECIES: 50S ribosomal protein L25/general stress protein Ctc [unclassified Myxococcus]NVJ02727.1 50S ribosomal protein L25/general stress protein Ctc [Myxococcus sp. AM009]NVJ18947.1 50S ribosomal protein L25/general stress protein Ctc [Myxococcus sp. AM010]
MSANTSTLEAKPREGSGKGVARRLRAQGLIPAVVYGKHLEKPVHISVDPKAVRQAINTPHKFNTLIQIKVEGGDRQVLLKDYQMEPVTRAILHADFLDVRPTEQVKVNVPLVLTGRAQGVADGGLLTQARREIEVWSLPAAIPERIEVDVTAMKIAEVLHINDLKLPQGVSVKTNVNYTLAVISAPEAAEAGPAAAAAAPAAKDAKAAPAKDAKAPAKK